MRVYLLLDYTLRPQKKILFSLKTTISHFDKHFRKLCKLSIKNHLSKKKGIESTLPMWNKVKRVIKKIRVRKSLIKHIAHLSTKESPERVFNRCFPILFYYIYLHALPILLFYYLIIMGENIFPASQDFSSFFFLKAKLISVSRN